MKKEEKMVKLVEYAKVKFKKYKLEGWHLYFTNHRGRTLGTCYYDRRRIRMSIPWVDSLGINDSKNTFLHELAHALSPVGAHHGHVWRKNCQRVGCKDRTRHCTIKKPLKKKYTRR